MRARARKTDPQTSYDAADSVKDLTGVQSRILGLFDLATNGLTDEELVQAYGRIHASYFPSSDSSLRSRRSELVVLGQLRDSGQKRLTKAHRATTVWDIWRLL